MGLRITGYPNTIAGNFTVTGQILAADGTVGAQGYAFSAESSNGPGWYRAGNDDMRGSTAGADVIRIGSGVVTLTAGGLLAWGSSGVTGADVIQARDAAGIQAQRNAANAQVSRIYNTFTTVTTVGEWFEVDWQTTANTCRIRTNAGSSTGTVRAMVIQPALPPNGTNVTGAAVSVISGAGLGNLGGGALAITGGAGGATGAGASVTVTSGIGGATSGNSGALVLATGTVTSGTVGSIGFSPGGVSAATITSTGLNISNGTGSQAGGVADTVSLGAYDLSAGNATLAIGTETAVAVDVALASTHSLTIRINGTSYRVLLAT